MLEDLPPAAWGAVVTALGLILAALARWGPDRAGAAAVVTNAGVALINELQEQNALLKTEIAEFRTENNKLRSIEDENRTLRSEVTDLRNQVRALQLSIDQLRNTGDP